VIFLDDDIVEGKSVNSGQVLFSVSGKGFADNNSSVRYMEAKNNYEKAKSDYERTKELAKDKIVSERELLNAKNQYENARIIYNNLNDNFDATGQKVTSSVNGYIKHMYVKNGEHVEPGQRCKRNS